MILKGDNAKMRHQPEKRAEMFREFLHRMYSPDVHDDICIRISRTDTDSDGKALSAKSKVKGLQFFCGKRGYLALSW